MLFLEAMKASCLTCEKACNLALMTSRADSVNARMSASIGNENPVLAKKPRGTIREFLFGASSPSTPSPVSTVADPALSYDADTRRASVLLKAFEELRASLLVSKVQSGLPTVMSRSAEALGKKSAFILKNGLRTSQRRPLGLGDLEDILEAAGAMLSAALAWNPPAAASVNDIPRRISRGYKGALGTTRKQIAMDFSGEGRHDVVTRVWLPVPAARTREMIDMGARYDPEAPHIGSRLWVPLDESAPFDAVLPLAFRQEPTRFSYPPIRHGAVGQNLGKVFDRESWNRIRKDAYARSGHRCQICGKQESGMWSRIATPKERTTPGLVDCHEVWDWDVPDPGRGVGIQRLKRLLVLCKDCHMSFHDGFALSRARAAGIETEVRVHIDKIRMLTNRLLLDAVQAGVSADKEAWESNRSVRTWVLDLTRIAAQDIMSDHTLVLDPQSAAGTGPDQVGGTEFIFQGARYAVTNAEELASGGHARLAKASGERRI